MNNNTKIVVSLVVIIIIGVFVYTQTLNSKRDGQSIQSAVATEQSPIAYEVINGVTVPPEPDPELNNATLAGVDVNENGVRDDVERYIVLNYSNSQKRMAVLFELAIGNRESLLAADANEPTSAISAIRRTDSVISCLHYIDPINAALIENRLTSVELNTEQRWIADAKLQTILGGLGMTVPTDKKVLCTFDPDTLPN